MSVFKTIIVPSAYVAAARTAAAAIEGGTGMFTTGASASGNLPATHYVSSGYMDEQIPAAIVGATISDAPAEEALAAAGLQIIRPPIVW